MWFIYAREKTKKCSRVIERFPYLVITVPLNLKGLKALLSLGAFMTTWLCDMLVVYCLPYLIITLDKRPAKQSIYLFIIHRFPSCLTLRWTILVATFLYLYIQLTPVGTYFTPNPYSSHVPPTELSCGF